MVPVATVKDDDASTAILFDDIGVGAARLVPRGAATAAATAAGGEGMSSIPVDVDEIRLADAVCNRDLIAARIGVGRADR